jgi:RimJ/RimL family protein N-acetyltransferase
MQDQVKRFNELVGKRLLLKPITDRDYALYASLYGDDNILRYISPALDSDTLCKSFASAVKLSQQDSCKRSFLVAVLKETDEQTGILGLTVTKSIRQIEVGIIFLPEYQKQNLAYEALQILITFLCNQYFDYKIIAKINPQNRAAVWLANRLGFRYNNVSALFELEKLHKPLWG